MIPAIAGFALLACSAPGSPDTLVVFAASSLTESFAELEAAFERAHPGVDVQIVTAGSQVLRLQLEQGARADVFASANLEHAEALARQGVVGAPVAFASNALALALPADNPAQIEQFADLVRAERLVVGATSVPIGLYTEALLARASTRLGHAFENRVRASIVSRESNVRLVRAKVLLGEADAAIVYRTDVAEGLKRVDVPAEIGVQVAYPIAVVRDAPQPELARSFVRFVLSPQGRDVLQSHGFSTGTTSGTEPGAPEPRRTRSGRLPSEME